MAFLNKLYKRFFPKIIFQDDKLIINNKEVPGIFEEYEDNEYLAIIGSLKLRVKRSNIRYFITNGTLWWGWKSRLVDGVRISDFEDIAEVVLKLKLSSIEILLRESSSFIPEEITDVYEMYINGILVENRLFNLFPGETIYLSGRIITKSNIKNYLSTGNLYSPTDLK